MKVQTYLFGEVEVSPERVITFPNGLAGLEGSKRFMLIHDASQEDPASYTLQSLDEPDIALQIADPAAIGCHYELALSDTETALLHSPASEDLAVMLVLFKPEKGSVKGIAANIRAPIVINTRARVGIQKIIAKPSSNVTISNLASAV